MYGHRQIICPAFSLRARRLGFALASVLLSVPEPCHAAFRACRPTDKPLVCRLESILTFLYATAIILGLLLACAVFAAVRSYKRKSRKLSPDEITPDA